ncbi:MAG: hypothetical protein EOP84_15250 [Verrucomicrobiaceae bacterium]|nr:MAG: hypothetical protein EOP84_15250 [Verrucomicrobiaceae bacterium]
MALAPAAGVHVCCEIGTGGIRSSLAPTAGYKLGILRIQEQPSRTGTHNKAPHQGLEPNGRREELLKARPEHFDSPRNPIKAGLETIRAVPNCFEAPS